MNPEIRKQTNQKCYRLDRAYPVTECRQRIEFTLVVVSVLGSSLKLSKTETSRWLSRVPAAVSVSHKVGTLETATEMQQLSSPIAKVI